MSAFPSRVKLYYKLLRETYNANALEPLGQHFSSGLTWTLFTLVKNTSVICPYTAQLYSKSHQRHTFSFSTA